MPKLRGLPKRGWLGGEISHCMCVCVCACALCRVGVQLINTHTQGCCDTSHRNLCWPWSMISNTSLSSLSVLTTGPYQTAVATAPQPDELLIAISTRSWRPHRSALSTSSSKPASAANYGLLLILQAWRHVLSAPQHTAYPIHTHTHTHAEGFAE